MKASARQLQTRNLLPSHPAAVLPNVVPRKAILARQGPPANSFSNTGSQLETHWLLSSQSVHVALSRHTLPLQSAVCRSRSVMALSELQGLRVFHSHCACSLNHAPLRFASPDSSGAVEIAWQVGFQEWFGFKENQGG